MRQRLHPIARRTASLLSGAAVLALLAYGGVIVAGYRPLVVYSGSMEPTLHVGSLVFVKRTPAAALRVGDIITFDDPHVSGKMDTHRIIRILQRPNGGLAFRTKGDANRDRDPWTIALPGAAGRERFTVPFAGYVMWYIRTREVRTILIGLVALSTLVSLLRHIWRREPAPAAEGQ